MEDYLKDKNLKFNMGNKIFGILFLFLFVITFSSAYEPHQQNTNYSYSETVANADRCNLTSITYPDGTTAELDIEMSKSGFEFSSNILSANFSQLGDTCWAIVCSDDDAEPQHTDGIKCLEVTYTGDTIKGSGASFYIISVCVLFVLMLLSFYGSLILPKEDYKDFDGQIITINKLKHFRPVLWTFSWLMLLGVVFIVANMTLAYLPSSMVGDLFFTVFQIMGWFSLIAIPITFIWIIVRWWQDKQTQTLIDRGVGFSGM